MRIGSPSRRRCLLLVWLAVLGSAAVCQTAPAAGFRVSGTVVSKIDSHPLGSARIALSETKNRKKFESVITSENGRFEFTGVPAGKYSLIGAKKGFIAGGYDQHDEYATAIVTGAGIDTEHLVLKLAPDAMIFGRVLDEFGEGVRQANVTLYYLDHSGGVDRIRQSSGAQTDDLGAYEISPLRLGTYFLSAHALPWYAVHSHTDQSNHAQGTQTSFVDRNLDVAYPITFYADTAEADSATPIPVQGGDRLQVDIHLNPVPALHLLFHVGGDASRGVSIPQLLQPTFDSSTDAQNGGVQMVSPGVWEMIGVPAGRYNVRISGGPAVDAQMNDIDLSRDGEELDTTKAEALSAVKVSVRVAGDPTMPGQLFIGLSSGRRTSGNWVALDAKGEAEISELAPGPYEFQVQAQGKLYSISHMMAEGAQITGHSINVTAGSSPIVSLTLVEGVTEIQGIVKKSGKGFAGAMVVLAPDNAEVDHDLFRRDQSDLDGTFVMHGVIPGAYTLLAIENGWDLDWSQPNVLKNYLKGGSKIKIVRQAGDPMNAEPIEVQSK